MDHDLALLALAAAAFAVTNIDGMLVLLGFFADRSFRTSDVIVGEFAGIAVLIVVSLTGSLVALVLPPICAGLLGLVPLGIGASRLTATLRGERRDEAPPPRMTGSGIIAVASVVISNGVDNVLTYTPLFATAQPSQIPMIVVLFFAMTGIWCAVAQRLARHNIVGQPLSRYGAVFLPVVLMVLGASIILRMGARQFG